MPEQSPSPATTTRPALRSFGELWATTWTSYNRYFPRLLALSVIINAVQIISLASPLSSESDIINRLAANPAVIVAVVLLFIAAIIAAVWGSLALYFFIAFPDQSSTMQDAFRKGGPFFLNSLTTGILTALIIFGGMLLFIVPGIYWGVVYSLSGWVVFKENLANTAALRRSKELISGYWWAVVWRQLILGFFLFLVYAIIPGLFLAAFRGISETLANLVSNIISVALIVLTAAIPVLFQAALYDALIEIKKPPIIKV